MRKVEDVRDDRELGLDVVSRPVNTYVRPQAPQRGQLTNIAETLTRFNPELQKFLHKKAEEKRNFEVAVGMDLYRKYGPDATAEDIKAMIDRGEVEGFRKLTKHHWNGIVQMRHKALADSIATHMRAWGETATLEGPDGAVPLSQVNDQSAVIAAFEREQQRYIEETTSGTYDKMLFGEIIEEQINKARNVFIDQQGKARSNQLELEKTQAHSQLMDATFNKFYAGGKLVLDSENAPQQLADALWENAIFAMREGLSLDTALQNTANWLITKMRNVDLDNVDQLNDVAKLIKPLWNTPELAKQVEIAGQNSIDEKFRCRQLERYERSQQIQEEVYATIDGLVETYGSYYDIPISEWEKLMYKFKTAGLSELKGAMDVIDAITGNIGKVGMSMSPTKFSELTVAAMRGKLKRDQLFNASPYMNSEQYGQLHRLMQESKADGGKRNELFEQAWGLILPAFGLKNLDLANLEGKEIRKIFQGAGAIFNKTWALIEKAGPDAKSDDAWNIAGQVADAYKATFEAIKNDPKLIDEPVAVRKKEMVAVDARKIITNIVSSNKAVTAELTKNIDQSAQEGKVFKPTIAECKELVKAAGSTKTPKVFQEEIVRASKLMLEYYGKEGD